MMDRIDRELLMEILDALKEGNAKNKGIDNKLESISKSLSDLLRATNKANMDAS